MAIDPTATGMPSPAHVSLREAAALRQGVAPTLTSAAGTSFALLESPATQAARALAIRQAATTARSAPARSSSTRSVTPHTPVRSSGDADPDQWDGMLNRIGAKYNVPPLFLKAVMLSESGGRPDAIGDSGHSVGLFQLHDQGYGAGMGDARFDPETNVNRAALGLAEAWHAGERAGFTGEQAVRAAYHYSFNPGGGWAYQGDAVVRNYNELLAAQGLPPLS
jgi:soluble lytic murein transglycosylase-like protein